MKKTLLNIIRIVSCFVLLLMLSVNSIQAQEAFVIDDLTISMKVEEDGSIYIEEKYQMDFTQERHGFYRTIPMRYDMNFTLEGKEVNKKYYFPVTDITSSDKMEIEYSKDGVSIRLGDEDATVYGKKDYTISYRVQTKDLDLNGKQLLYWNIVGTEFDTQIKHVSFTIAMPKSFNTNEIQMYTGRYGVANEFINWNVDGQTIYGSTDQTLYNYEGLSISAALPSDYFQFPAPKDYGMISSGITLLLSVICILLFLRFGRDEELIIPIEFHAPKGLNSAEVGYIIDQSANTEDLLSLIIEWANKGYIIIHDDKEKGFMLEKIKDIDPDSPYYERQFFRSFFQTSSKVNEEDLKKQNMGNHILTAKQNLRNAFHYEKKKEVYHKGSQRLQWVALVLLSIPTLLFMLLNSYGKYDLMALAWPSIFYAVAFFVFTIPWIFLVYHRHAMKPVKFALLCALVGAINILIVAICAYQLLSSGMDWWAVLIYVLGTGVIFVCMLCMNKKTKQGVMWLSQILGFKEFIETCEKDRLEMLVEDEPTLFYDILPYAYVLGVSDVWAKKFESINIGSPSWYQGNYSGDVFSSMIFYHHFHHCFHDIHTATTYIEPSDHGTGGGSFGSGSGSSFGGFSGGGFGGGGGGSW